MKISVIKIFLGIVIIVFGCIQCGGSDATEEAATYTITYDGNGNTGGSVPVDAATYEEAAAATVLGNTGSLERTGYSFVNWNTAADGSGTDYDGGDILTMGTANVILYAQWSLVYEIGDTGPAGGLVFYDRGAIADGWRYLEAAPTDQSDGVAWYNGTHILTGADETAIGSGSANTDAIIAAQGTGSYAAQICADLDLGGYDDWFLPSADELDAMFDNLAHYGLGSFSAEIYWSSTETMDDFADCQYMGSGSANDSEKNNTYRVRAARAF